LPNLHHVWHGGKAVRGASIRRPSWDPAVETSVVAGTRRVAAHCDGLKGNSSVIVHRFADNHTQNSIYYGFALSNERGETWLRVRGSSCRAEEIAFPDYSSVRRADLGNRAISV
jgi:hypothetical protein